ncbi:MAG TPA: hypothetical protein VKW06_07190 [Candidatus Angelobacter sp.]|nr:hypothetical protein [Candidatus Angelobacter sp.]
MKKLYFAMFVALSAGLLCSSPIVCAQDNQERGAEQTPTAKNPAEKGAKELGSEKNKAESSPGYNPINFPEAQGPVELRSARGAHISLKQTDDSRAIYEAIGRQAKINVLFDPDYTPRNISIDIAGVSLQDALRIAAFQSRTFWRPVTSDTIFVAADTQAKRHEFEQQMVKTFYFPNIWSSSDLQDVVNGLRTIVEVQRIQQFPAYQTITVRTTPEQMAVAEKMIEDLNRAKSKTGGQYRLEFKISETGEGKNTNARVYNLLLEPHQVGKLRIGPRIPIQTSDKEKTYLEAGKNIDCQVRMETEHSVSMRLTVEFSDVGLDEHGAPELAHGDPVLQQLKIDTGVTLELGVPTVVSSFQDPTSKHNFQIEATAVRTKTRE